MELPRLLVATTLLLLALSACSGAVPSASPAQQAAAGAAVSSARSAPTARPTSHWADVLQRLDRRRAIAYASAAPRSLSGVYAPGSTALRRDRCMLRAYQERGIALSRVRLDLRAVHLRARHGREVRLRVVDQLRRPIAHIPGGAAMLLPQDQPTQRVIVLRRHADTWRIASVQRIAG
ncbi:MAG: hypothetical protein H0V48_04050 [Nocardioidaceae bacterium]|nr:hypothetical protein [Nocardioidaceae bacterium]